MRSSSTTTVRAPQRLLVIEDDRDLADVLVGVLWDEGYFVTLANDGLIGLQMLLDAPILPDVILLDMMMPNMDGATFRKRQLAETKLAGIPTLVMTGQSVDARTRSSMGDVPILRKPLKLAHLLASIHRVFEPVSPQKRCACGRQYDGDAWRALRLVGEIDNGRNVNERLELRNCLCGSTVACELGRHAVSINVFALC